jgi:hypothetical protein
MNHNEPSYDYLVVPLQSAAAFGVRYRDNVIADTDMDLKTRRAMLGKFQKIVMDAFHNVLLDGVVLDDGFLEFDDDEQLEMICPGVTSEDVVDVYRMYREFMLNFPVGEIITMIPIDMSGTVGVVVEPKPMKHGSPILSFRSLHDEHRKRGGGRSN